MEDKQRFKFWVDRGDTKGTPALVSPGSKDSRWERWTRNQLQDWAWRRVLRYAPDKVDRAIDLGCGYGDWTERYIELARHITAVDISPGFVQQTSARLKALGHESFDVVCSDIREFHQIDGADIVHLGAIFTYLNDDECLEVLSRIRKDMSPTGLLHQRDYCAVNGTRPRENHRDSGLISYWRAPQRYVELAKQAGFRVLESKRSPGIYGEQTAYNTLGFRTEALTKVTGWLPSLFWRLGTLPWRACSASFFYAPA